MSLVLGIIGAGLTYVTLHKFEVDHLFANVGQTVTATVLSTSVAHREHTVRYEFRIDGQTYQGAADFPRGSLKNAARSQEIDVSYLPSDPAINRPAEEKNLPVVTGLIPLTQPSLLFVVIVRQLRRDFVLAKIGRLTTGIVVGVLSRTWLYYDFLNDRGAVTRGKSWLPAPYSLQIVSGSSVQVLYLPGYPEQNALKLSMYWQT